MDPGRVRRLLEAARGSHRVTWPWLTEDQPADKRNANKFFFGAILDYQMPAQAVWKKACHFTEETLGDPPDLWVVVVGIFDWNARFREYHLHRFPKAHERVRRIGQEIVKSYGGDARRIWKGEPPQRVLKRLLALRTGPQIARMIVGALHDTGQITGSGELKADLHVRRVLGRVFTGESVSVEKEHELANRMIPEGSWKVDAPLYLLGKAHRRPTDPRCPACFLEESCAFRAK